MTTIKIPAYLSAAYEWTNAAGELEVFGELTSTAALEYAVASAENFEQNPSGAAVSVGDLLDLHSVLKESTDLK
jgi:hypothetical protein